MVRFEEMTVGVRRVRGPISDVVDLDRRGARLVAIAFQEAYRDDQALAAGIDPFRDFLELPMVEGVAPLAAWRRGVFAYPVPRGRTVRELIGVFAEEGGGGLRAALELIAEALVPLSDAARSGADRGLRSHGALDPWRLVVDERGQITVIGYGLPPLDILDFQRDESMLPTGDSLRYCPPERLDAEPEDWRSDLFSLALMAAELCSGKPVYEGSETQILNAVSGCDAPKLLERYPAPLVSVLRQAVSPFADQRPGDPRAVIDAARRAAERAPGRKLAELVQAAAPYLSDVEDELPAGTPIVEIVGPPPDEPQRQAAIALATEAAGQASATVEAMAAMLEASMAQPDEGLTGVVQVRAQAQQALDMARAAADRADQAADAAMQAGDAPSAEAQAKLALSARQELATLQGSFEAAIAESRRLVEEAQKVAAERREQAVATARRAVAQAEAALTSLLASAEGVELDLDDVEQHVGAAKAASRKVEASRDVGAAERACERVVVAARAAEEAAGAALAKARAAVERVASARAAVAVAEAAYRGARGSGSRRPRSGRGGRGGGQAARCRCCCRARERPPEGLAGRHPRRGGRRRRRGPAPGRAGRTLPRSRRRARGHAACRGCRRGRRRHPDGSPAQHLGRRRSGPRRRAAHRGAGAELASRGRRERTRRGHAGRAAGRGRDERAAGAGGRQPRRARGRRRHGAGADGAAHADAATRASGSRPR
jgi:hypothetical protein